MRDSLRQARYMGSPTPPKRPSPDRPRGGPAVPSHRSGTPSGRARHPPREARVRFSASRRAGLIVAAAGLVGGTMVAASAQAFASQSDPSQLATKLAGQLGARSAVAYLDHSTNKLVVTVTSKADAKTVRDAGAVPKTVAFSGAQLKQATSTLESTAKVPGTAWAVDPATDQVVLSVD